MYLLKTCCEEASSSLLQCHSFHVIRLNLLVSSFTPMTRRQTFRVFQLVVNSMLNDAVLYAPRKSDDIVITDV
jgi:hypothetical protein